MTVNIYRVMLWLIALLTLAPAPSPAAWHKATSPNFIVYAEGKGARASELAAELERFDQLLRFLTDAKGEPSPNRLIILEVRNHEAVQELLSRDSSSVVGFYSPDLAGTVAVVPRNDGDDSDFALKSRAVLYHEYAHHFMLHYFPAAYPAWYVEGFAEYLSTVEFRKDKTVAIGLPAQHRFSSLASYLDYDVRRLLTGSGPAAGESEPFYAYSWLLTHYLRHETSRKGQLDAYLRAFAGGKTADESAALLGDGRKLGVDLARYIRSNRLSYMFFKGLPQQIAVADVAELDAPTSEMMPLFMRLTLGIDTSEQAKRFVAGARKALARFPGHAVALELLAEGELAAGNTSAATTANDALIALTPGNARALLRRARIAAAKLDKNATAEQWRAVRSLVVAANRMQPDDAFILVKFFETYAGAGQPPSEAAVEGLHRALFLAPQVRSTRLTLGSLLLARREGAEGKAVLAPLLYDPHNAALRETARKLIATYDAGGPVLPPDPESEPKK